jgi:UDP-N-acetyl-D-galactosamine dehydrogenase
MPSAPSPDPAALPDLASLRLGVVGLGYVGLPLAVAFAERLDVVGFDLSQERIDELAAGHDRTLEVPPDELARAARLTLTCDAQRLAGCGAYVVTVPTPIDDHRRPDLGPLERASQTIGGVMAPGAVVIYESTVYPGATEEVCVPILERASGLRYNHDFYCGYSPERVNPGDPHHRLADIAKVTAGSTPEAADFVDALYHRIIRAGTHRASSIRVAEAAKVIENTQRDVNIALVNELALLFHRLGIDTQEVLEAAGTKWNFLPFRPGLVGGHCIGVDPYYLTYKAQEIGYDPQIILAGRRINDQMGRYVAEQVIRLLHERGIAVAGARALVMGLTFKENCPDLRNSQVADLIAALREHNVGIDTCDPWVDPREAAKIYGKAPVVEPERSAYDAVVLAVAHRQFADLGAATIRAFGKPECVLYDVKSLLPASATDGRL